MALPLPRLYSLHDEDFPAALAVGGSDIIWFVRDMPFSLRWWREKDTSDRESGPTFPAKNYCEPSHHEGHKSQHDILCPPHINTHQSWHTVLNVPTNKQYHSSNSYIYPTMSNTNKAASHDLPDMMSECPICMEALFDDQGIAQNGPIAKIMCYHLVHSDCLAKAGRSLNADGKRYGMGGMGARAGCPVCNRPVSY